MSPTADIIEDYNIEHANCHQFVDYPRYKGFIDMSFKKFKDGGS